MAKTCLYSTIMFRALNLIGKTFIFNIERASKFSYYIRQPIFCWEFLRWLWIVYVKKAFSIWSLLLPWSVFFIVSITSPTMLYISTNAQSPYYSHNDDKARRVPQRDDIGDTVRLIDVLERTCWLNVRTVLQDGEIEIQDLIAFFGTFYFLLFRFILS